MNVPIYLKDGFNVSQPMAEKPWKFGTLIGATVGGDERPYAIVLTEHQEFELVHWYQIEGVTK